MHPPLILQAVFGREIIAVRSLGFRASTGEHMKEMIDKLVANRCPIHVCKACVDRRHISPDELIDGAAISASGVLLRMMVDPDYKVITL